MLQLDVWIYYLDPCNHLDPCNSSILMLFYYLAPLQNDSIMMSRCMQFTFEDEREVYLLDDSALPVAKNQSMWEGKRSPVPLINY